jgi:Hom_end-associated Hint/LAGLIDADG-like domain
MITNERYEKKKTDKFFSICKNEEELRAWFSVYFGLRFPMDTIDPDSTSNPVHAAYTIYAAVRDNTGDVNPGFIMLSSRDSYKTLVAAALETVILFHFRITIAHMAAIRDQSDKAISYVDSFVSKTQPYWSANGWKKLSDNKKKTEFLTDKGERPYLTVIICTMAGANGEHCSLVVADELDVVRDPRAYDEAMVGIPSTYNNRHPIVVKLSTRKFAFGLMQKELDRAKDTGEKILRWNILDLAEKCPTELHGGKDEVFDRYVANSLPLKTITVEEFQMLSDNKKHEWSPTKAYKGCLTCPLLPVCKTRLADKPDYAHINKTLYKSISTIKGAFKRAPSPDIAEAQLLCFGEQTKILMGDGTLKNIAEIKIGDQVVTHTGNIQKVSEVFKRPFSGKAYQVSNHSFKHFPDTVVTGEHPYFINGNRFETFEFDKYGAVKTTGDYASLPSKYSPSSQMFIRYTQYVPHEVDVSEGEVRLTNITGRHIPLDFPINYDFGWIVGYYLAEGFLVKDRRYKNYSLAGISFCSDEREIEYHEKVKTFASSIGLTTSGFKAKVGHGYTLDIYNKTLAELFYVLCGEISDKKKLHPDLINANPDFLRGVLSGFDAGDGTKRKNSYRELTTCSEELASQLFFIASRFGLCPRITKMPMPPKGKQPYKVHHIDPDYVSKQQRTRYKFENEYNQYRIDKKVEVEYDGFVYNIEVPGDHSYIANGVAVHNCWKPSSKGLVYPRFVDNIAAPYPETNTVTISEAYYKLMGELPERPVTHQMLITEIVNLNLPVYSGLDWGYTKEFAFQVYCHMPWGDVWVLDTFGMPELELDDQVGYATQYQERYGVLRWWVDPAYPANKKTFNKKGLKSPDFTKDIMGGIEAFRGLIVDSLGNRRLKILVANPEIEDDKLGNGNQKLISALKVHHFKLDAQGNITKHPDDGEFSDTCDAARYYAQNMHGAKSSGLLVGKDAKDRDSSPTGPKIVKKRTYEEDVAAAQEKLMQRTIRDLSKTDLSKPQKPKKKRGIVWNI